MHDHGPCWVVYGNYQNPTRMRRWRRLDDGSRPGYAELTLQPGQTAKLHARLFDGKGRFLREEKATWSLQGLKGTVTDGTFVAGTDPLDQAGIIKATGRYAPSATAALQNLTAAGPCRDPQLP